MIGGLSTTDVASRIQQLMSERQQHADALSRIDQTLERIGSLLHPGQMPRRRGRPPKNAIFGRAPVGRPPGRPAGRRKRRTFAISGNESIINFVREHKNPSTKEIKEHWMSEDRGGKVDNALTKLVKEKKLKRTPLGEGIRGSRYSLP